ncbi:MAG: tRNA 2-thiocytidine biosynthesis protein TtcA [Ruminococcus sp.]|uniref:tRNA 2-thiocytidine biosynthesis TtcA family protein n=1 Tax=Ruminococcus sp. TaxID=41978 RepID=UPI0025E14377|nr:ATP-binding protein [Ruminococcus sp.]MCR5540127.1 tRNA 2-thiocytidine biosynthesis protein TtcA [Ruminococcus sp.]
MSKKIVIPNDIELSVVKKFRREIWSRFLKGIKDYELIQEGDKIAVCISGGKDSMLMALCMKRLQRYSKVPFEVVFLVMNPGYNEINYQKIIENAETLDIPIQVFETGIFDAVAKVDEHPCYLCARMRRGYLYKTAKEMGCNKIALGHHFDDVIETILMGMLYGSQVQTMMPKIHSENYEGMQLIRPLYMVREADIIHWKQYNDLQFIQCACRFTENCTMCDNGGGGSKRQEVKNLLKQLRAVNPAVDMNIFRSVENVNLQTIISYHMGDEYHHFLDRFDEGRSVRGTKAEGENG